mgnify:CR=1 FL=1|tara:strand:- start:3 stop:1229 length:1227 start_codon:yes stop_codon:yes gene_type:complete
MTSDDYNNDFDKVWAAQTSRYTTWILGRGLIAKEGVDTQSDLWRFYRHQFIYAMSYYLFSKKIGVNDPIDEILLAKQLFIDIFGEEINAEDKNTNTTINTYLKLAQLIYRDEVRYLEDKRRLSFGINKTRVDRLYKDKIDQEGNFQKVNERSIRPSKYEKSITQLEKEFNFNQIQRLKDIEKFQFTNPILYERLYSQITEFQFSQLKDNQEFPKGLMEVQEFYNENVIARDKVSEYQPFNYEDVFDQETGKQINFEEPTYDPNYKSIDYMVANPVSHDKESLKLFDYHTLQSELKMFPFLFPFPTVNYTIEQHENIRDLFYSVRQTVNGVVMWDDVGEKIPRKQLRCNLSFRYQSQKLAEYIGSIKSIFPTYHSTMDMKEINNLDNCYGAIHGEFQRIKIKEDESFEL